jgi:hypothetical protein
MNILDTMQVWCGTIPCSDRRRYGAIKTSIDKRTLRNMKSRCIKLSLVNADNSVARRTRCSTQLAFGLWLAAHCIAQTWVTIPMRYHHHCCHALGTVELLCFGLDDIICQLRVLVPLISFSPFRDEIPWDTPAACMKRFAIAP